MDRIDNHPTNESLEDYAFKRLPELDQEQMEDHLLLCESCQMRLQELEEFIRATRDAAQRLRKEDLFRTSEFSFWRRLARPFLTSPAWTAAAGCALLIIFLVNPRFPRSHAGYQEISLTAMRGSERKPAPSSNDWLRLKLDIRRLAPFDSAQVQIVESGGRTIWHSGTLRPEGGLVTVALGRKLAPGVYWVRLAAGPSWEVQREYELMVK